MSAPGAVHPSSHSDVPSTPSLFQDLLSRLAKEHERAIGALRAENEQLRANARHDSQQIARNDSQGARSDSQIARNDSQGARSDSQSARHDPSQPMSPTSSDKTILEENAKVQECSKVALQAAANPANPASVHNGVLSMPATDPDREEHTTSALFELKKEWHKLPVAAGNWGQAIDRYMINTLSKGLQAGAEVDDDEDHYRMLRRNLIRSTSCVIHPSGTGKLLWDLTGLVLISYDFITIPMQVFDLEKNWFTVFMGILTLVFWTCDMVQSFFAGFYKDGMLVMDKRQIALRYVRTWFLIDIIVVGPDWVMTALGSSSIAGIGRVFRAARAVRVLRLLRLAKVQKVMTMMYDLLDSEYAFIVLNLVKLLLFILVLNHVIACAWYWIGTITMESGEINWVQHAGYTPVYATSWAWRYTTSLHWSLTQFTPAGMDVSARNVAERIFSVFVLFFALVAFSSVIGSVSGSMTALRNLKGGDTKQFWLLRRYLKQKGISRDLSGRVLKYLEHQNIKKMNQVQAKNISILSDMSEQLSIEISCELYSPHLLFHPFFKYLDEEMRVMLHRITFVALKSFALAADDVVFTDNDEAKRMFFVQNGKFSYKQVDGMVLDPPLRTKAWISEAVLWTPWRHRGELQALTPSDLIAVQPTPFMEAMKMHPRSWCFAKTYGQRFVDFLNSVNPSALTDVLCSDEFFKGAVESSDQSDVRSLRTRDSESGSCDVPELPTQRNSIGNGPASRGIKKAWSTTRFKSTDSSLPLR